MPAAWSPAGGLYPLIVRTGDRLHSTVLTCLWNMGHAYEEVCNFSESLSCYEQAFKMRKALYNDWLHHELVSMLENIAHIHECMNNYEAALERLQQAEEMYQRLCDRYDYVTDSNIARVLHKMGRAKYYLGDVQEALQYHKTALDINERLYTKGAHIRKAISMEMVGSVYGSLGKYKQAEKYYKKSLKMAQNLGEQYFCADIHCLLSRCYYSA